MNILYIDHYAGSLKHGMEFRPYYLAREWVKNGHKVTIVGGDYSHLRTIQPVLARDFQFENIDGIEYLWVKTGVYHGNGIKRALSMLRFVGKLYLHANRVATLTKPDVIISSSTYPLDTYASQRIKKLSGGILVHEVHDMWPITPIELYGMSRYHPFVLLMQAAENSFCKCSDLIVSVLPCAEQYFLEHGLGEHRFICVENGIVEEDWNEPSELPDQCLKIINKAKSEGRFILGFYGSHTKAYCLDYLLQAAATCDTNNLFLLFVGNGNYKNDLIDLAQQLGLDNNCYAFIDPIPKKSIPSLLQHIDFSYIGATKNQLFRFGIGMNKLFDALMGGKPILYAVEAPNNLIIQYNCGISVEPENVRALSEGLNKLLSLSADERRVMGQNGHRAAIEKYTYSVLSKRFLDSIISIRKYGKLIPKEEIKG